MYVSRSTSDQRYVASAAVILTLPPCGLVMSQKTYAAAVDTVKELSHVVDRLYGKAKKLHSFK